MNIVTSQNEGMMYGKDMWQEPSYESNQVSTILIWFESIDVFPIFVKAKLSIFVYLLS